MAPTIARVLGAWVVLAAASHAPQASARGIQVNLTASWPSSPLYPLLEASEFLAEENPLFFWRYVDALSEKQAEIATKADDVDVLASFAVDVAQGIAPHATNMLELTISTRAYSAKVEMFRQLALDSSARACRADTETWAVVYKDTQCVTAVACSISELDAALATLANDNEASRGDVCVVAGINDVELSGDHKYPHPSFPRDGTVILYGSLASADFAAFHRHLLPLAKDGTVAYILRHFPKDSTLETLLQGYGVALDIKNMEYKTIDDSKKDNESGEDEEEEEEMQDDEEDDEDGGADDEIDGLIFSKLAEQFPKVQAELKAFHDQLAKQHDQGDHEIKAWHLKDIGIAATREILDAKNPLKRLRILSQDFPKHAKKLALSRKPLSDELRAEIEVRRTQASNMGLLNRFLVNGIPVDPMQRSFNIFDFVSTLKKEWSTAKKLAELPLTSEERDEMLSSIRQSKPNQGAVRIRVRGPVDGVAPLYLNDIDTDHMTEEWPRQVAALRRQAWNLIFVRKNMYEYVIVFDPTTSQGRVALTEISFLRMRGAPLQWGFLISTKELMEAKTAAERDAIVTKYKKAEYKDKATGWHFAKLLLMAKEKDTPTEEGSTGRVVKGFIEGAAEETGDPSLEALIDCYLDTTGGSFSRSKSRAEALEALRSDEFDASVMAMTEMIGRKHLPFESTLFNGVLKTDLDIQGDLMNHFGRDQQLYQQLARTDGLSEDMDLVDELLTAQEAYPAFFSIFSGASTDDDSLNATPSAPSHLFTNDENAMLENLMATKVKFVNQPGTATLPKKQTLLFAADLSDPVHAAHVHRTFKAVQEDLGNVMRVGVIHRVSNGDDENEGDLVAAIIDALGNSDQESHVQVATEALACVAKGKTVEGTKTKLVGIIEKLPDWKADTILVQLKEALTTSGKLLLSESLRTTLLQLNRAIDAAQPRGKDLTSAQLYLNGFRIELPEQPISDEDISALISYDMKYRSQPIAKAFIKRSVTYTKEESSVRSMAIVKASAIVDEYRKAQRYEGIAYNSSSIAINLAGDESLRVTAYVDPLTEAAQRMSAMLVMLHSQLNATIELFPLPAADYSEFPIQRFYRYLFDKKPVRSTSVAFRRLPIKPILTMKMDTPEAWNVQIFRTADDLDNLRVDLDSPADIRATKSASFRVESLLVYGQCRDKTFDQYAPPNGLQLMLERDVGSTRLHRDTLVMKNFGYFQLQATPGVWNLHLARGRAVDLYEIVEPATDKRVPSTGIIVSGFTSRLEQLLVQKRPGKEMEELLVVGGDSSQSASSSEVEPIAADAGLLGSYWKSMLSMFGKHKADKAHEVGENNENALVTTGSRVNAGRTGETIHVFSLATGHLYERFIKIMMLSVLKRTKNPVTFWLLENFLSPTFKDSIPALRETFGMDIRLVTYKWPNWLRQQTQKQRIIWGYKILFLDVLFPLGVQKIIYVDADQVVRADLKELWEMDLQGAPYGYTPFCDSRNVGFQFWRQGYWKDHLRGRPYHISALYVVDLALFRQMAAGDMLRAIYDQLSADPNSLANLDQDLPNYAQHQIRIHSLPNEWLWCESWCSDDSKGQAKTIDLCNNPKHKEPKLDMAKRVIAGELFPESWVELDQEIKDAEKAYATATKLTTVA